MSRPDLAPTRRARGRTWGTVASTCTHAHRQHPPDPDVATRRAVTLVRPDARRARHRAVHARQPRRRPGRAAGLGAASSGLALLVALLWVVARGVVLAVFTLPTVLSLLGVLLILGGIAWPALVVDAWRLGVDPAMPTRSRRWVAGAHGGRRPADVGAGDRRRAAGVGGGRPHRQRVRVRGGRPRPSTAATTCCCSAATPAPTGSGCARTASRSRASTPTPAARCCSACRATSRTCRSRTGRRPRRRCRTAGPAATSACSTRSTSGGREHEEYFPGVKDPGAEAMKQAVQGITGLTVNYYVLIDLQGFRQLIDAVGGVTVDVRPRGADRRRDVAGVRAHQAGQAGARRLRGALVRAVAARVQRLRADGAPALRHERDARPARARRPSCGGSRRSPPPASRW